MTTQRKRLKMRTMRMVGAQLCIQRDVTGGGSGANYVPRASVCHRTALMANCRYF